MFENLFSLEGRTTLITGGSRGIGKMIAAGFVAQGARLADFDEFSEAGWDRRLCGWRYDCC